MSGTVSEIKLVVFPEFEIVFFVMYSYRLRMVLFCCFGATRKSITPWPTTLSRFRTLNSQMGGTFYTPRK